ncbi:hypothetical protein COTS27_01159 [Spirochaetota bacterium]|nr:hypothetical protein COTS27_01159 [Spirochaetota bacterium]
MKKSTVIIIVVLFHALQIGIHLQISVHCNSSYCSNNANNRYQVTHTPPFPSIIPHPSQKNLGIWGNIQANTLPLSPAFNPVPMSHIDAAKQLIDEALKKSLYSQEKNTPLKKKLAALLTARRDGNITTIKEQYENIINTGILHIYASNFTSSAKEFHTLYRVYERGEYLFYKALNGALYDHHIGKVEFSKYLRVAKFQYEGELWYNLATLLAEIIDKQTISNKAEYKALVKWFYDQYSLYTCFLMVKLYEKYIPITSRDNHDWLFIHTMNSSLLIKSGNPLESIAYIESHREAIEKFAPNLIKTLAITYYKTEQYEKAYQTFKVIPKTSSIDNAYYYYLALLQFKRKEFTRFKQTFKKLKANTPPFIELSPDTYISAKTKSIQKKNQNFIKKLDELSKLNDLVIRLEKKSVSIQ